MIFPPPPPVEKPPAHQLAEEMAKTLRGRFWNTLVMVELGWTDEQSQHWIETGEEPKS